MYTKKTKFYPYLVFTGISIHLSEKRSFHFQLFTYTIWRNIQRFFQLTA